MQEIICNRVLANASYECRRSLLLSWSESCKLFAVIWFCPWSRVLWERVSLFRYLSIYPAMNIIYLLLPNCSGNFNRLRVNTFATRFGQRFLQLPHSTLLSFASLYVCCCIIVFDSIIYLSQDIILNCCFNIYPIDHRVLLQVCLLSRNKLLLCESCLPDVLHERIPESCLLVSILI